MAPTSTGTLWTAKLLGLLLVTACGHGNGASILDHVDVMIAKAVADTDSGSRQGGFVLDGTPITGFSSMHDSGTGGSPSLGNFPLFPHASCEGDDINRCAFPKKTRARLGAYDADSIKAVPGYFGVTLSNGPKVEMTTTHHTSLFRFTFEAGRGSKPLILQDLTDLSDSRQDNGTIIVDAVKGRMTGDAVFAPSFAQGHYRLYFCTDFRGPEIVDSGIFVDSRASSSVKKLKISRSINGYPLPGGAFVKFANADQPILARVGLSFISSEQACSSAEREMPNFDLDSHAKSASEAWAKKLSPIQIEAQGVDESFVKSFYSGIYRSMISPQNYSGENPLWDDGKPYFDSYYCIWDLFRSQLPLLTVIDPDALAQIISSLISIYEHEGWLPDCRMTFNHGYTQGGSNADVVLADAFLKGIKKGIDWKKGYEAVKKDAEVEPFDWCCRGRGGLDSWKQLGYVPVQDFDYKGFGTMTRSISRTLEYSYNDFCVSQLAAGLGLRDDRQKYLSSSGNWRHLFKSSQTSVLENGTDTGFVGFFQPKFLNGTWGSQDALLCSNLGPQGTSCSLQNNGPETFESSIWEYGFFVPHEPKELIKLYGGPKTFVERLDYLNDNGINDIGNEPAFLNAFLYHYAGRPGLSARRTHFYIPQYFSSKPSGLPGNDDSGAMGSFVAFSMMGLFPNPGQNVYFIIPPFFGSVSITSPLTGKTATIRNLNFDPAYKNIYIQSATLNGEPYTKNWIDHSFFTEGKELVLTLGENESSWGTAPEDLPPSVVRSGSGLNDETLDEAVRGMDHAEDHEAVLDKYDEL
ncbi:hypothetical protein CDD83_9851 [Cordyceps sp. RAO-2017]|nr:hypothetical protein CDD83_9851 [Cordyceps sp. RAO-2017]